MIFDNIILKHYPVLTILVYLLGAAIIPIINFFNKNFLNKHNISIFTSLLSLILTIIYYINFKFYNNIEYLNYSLGGFDQNMINKLGQENINNFGIYFTKAINFKVNESSILLILYLNIILFIFLYFLRNNLIEFFKNNFDQSKLYIIYSTILITHAGINGLILTKDLFNLYVFLEIASLGLYSLYFISNQNKPNISSLDYLILGSIASSFILIGICMILFHLGTLDIDSIMNALKSKTLNSNNRYLLNIGVSSILIGGLMKFTIFPLHRWMRELYKKSDYKLLFYLSSASLILSFILINKIYLIFNSYYISNGSKNILILINITLVTGIIYYGYKSVISDYIRDIIVYSGFMYNNLILVYIFNGFNDNKFLVLTIIWMALVKSCYFYLLSYLEIKDVKDLNLKKNNFEFINYLKEFKNSFMNINFSAKLLFSVITLSLIGFPFSPGFFIKIYYIKFYILKNNLLIILITIFTSICSVLYSYKIFREIISNNYLFKVSNSNLKYFISSLFLSLLNLFFIYF